MEGLGIYILSARPQDVRIIKMGVYSGRKTYMQNLRNLANINSVRYTSNGVVHNILLNVMNNENIFLLYFTGCEKQISDKTR